MNKGLAELTSRSHRLGEFLAEAAKLHPDVSEALEGIWCGRDGRATSDLPDDDKHMLVVGWYNGNAEYAYIS